MNNILHLAIFLDIYIILAISINLISGYCGLLTVSHSAFFALGAYCYAILLHRVSCGFVPALFFAAVVGAICSLAMSLPSWRFKGDYFLLISLAVQVLILSLLNNWNDINADVGSFRNLTNGPYGIRGIQKPDILGFKFESLASMSVLATFIAAVSGLIVWRLVSSPWGRLLEAIRDDELVARGLGKNTRRAKVEATALACALAAVAGVIYASYVAYVDPTICSLDESVLVLAMVVVGGLGNFRGPIVGAVLLLAIPEVLRRLSFPDVQAANIRLLVYGLLLIFVIHVLPQGIAGKYKLE